MDKIFVIEHLEPELWNWCIIEYKHISKIVGKNNLWFCNVKEKDKNKLEKYGKVFVESVKNMALENVCVLDPEADERLTPEKSKSFNYFIFGGILGDSPPRKRTFYELTQFIKNSVSANIGKEQLSTDGAVYVVKEIINGKKLEEFKFVDSVEIKINEIESTSLPFKYPVLENGKSFLSEELVGYLRRI